MADPLPETHSRLIQHGRGERIKARGGWLSFLAVGEQTGGAYGLIETANEPSTGVPLHVHEREDETWFVLEGEYTFQVGDQTFRAGPGDYVFGPRQVPHSYANGLAIRYYLRQQASSTLCWSGRPQSRMPGEIDAGTCSRW
jgi:quercetin dioxygenase-like cupin family protein